VKLYTVDKEIDGVFDINGDMEADEQVVGVFDLDEELDTVAVLTTVFVITGVSVILIDPVLVFELEADPESVCELVDDFDEAGDRLAVRVCFPEVDDRALFEKLGENVDTAVDVSFNVDRVDFEFVVQVVIVDVTFGEEEPDLVSVGEDDSDDVSLIVTEGELDIDEVLVLLVDDVIVFVTGTVPVILILKLVFAELV